MEYLPEFFFTRNYLPQNKYTKHSISEKKKLYIFNKTIYLEMLLIITKYN